MSGFASHFTIDITETLDTKLESIRSYETQFPPEKAYVYDRIRGAALQAGAASGFLAGEVFVSTRPLGADNLMQVLHLVP
jgi:LmbE family N-acetylglucosaminyl deacetylase